MKGNRTVFWMVWAVALVPLVAAVLVWSSGGGLSGASVNRGELVQPVKTLDQWGGDPLLHTGHWSLLWVPTGDCVGGCSEAIERLRRVHDALGREADRVRVMSATELAPGVWVVDPLGNLVMQYPPTYEGQALLGDMRRLLKASRLG